MDRQQFIQYFKAIKETAFNAMLKEDFTDIGKVHDWRNYIPYDVRNIWSELSEETKMIAYYIADEAAGREDWE